MGVRALTACSVLATWLVVSAPIARAQDSSETGDPAFALTGGLAVRAGSIRGDSQLGGVLLFDVWYARGPLRLGGSTGITALFGDDEETRTLAPLLASIAIESLGPRLGFSMRFRGGLWAGATDDGLRAGPMLAGGLFLHYLVDPRISIAAGVDTLFLFSHGDTSLFVPSISLVFRPGTSPDDP